MVFVLKFKKPGLRTIRFWANYDPKTRKIVEQAKYKYQLPVMPGCAQIEMKGYYLPSMVEK